MLKFDRHSLLLYLVTDRTWLGGATLEEQVEIALRAGVTCVQLREKHMDTDAIIQQGLRLRQVCARYNVPLIINDNVEAALACGAQGVHIGQGDRPAREVRALLGTDKILGVSTATVEEAVRAQRDGADYLGVGAVFPTSTKTDARALSPATVSEICQSVSIPVVAIGGIAAHNITQLSGSGIAGAAIISAILAQPDIFAASQELLTKLKKVVAE